MDEIILLDQDDYMLSDPISYNGAIVNFFKWKYGDYIEAIFDRLQKEAQSEYKSWLKDLLLLVPKKVIERHLFPIFASANCSGGISQYHIDFAVSFIKSSSLPILKKDADIDLTNFNVDRVSTAFLRSHKIELTEFCSIYDGIIDFFKLPNANKIIKLFIKNYRQVYLSLYYDIIQRYNIDLLKYPKLILKKQLNSPLSLLTCKYFSTTTQSSILINKNKISPDVSRIMDSFGRLRQLCDQICDVKEDISMGILTIPILYAMIKNDSKFDSLIKELWIKIKQSTIDLNSDEFLQYSNAIKNKVKELKGLERAYRLADKWYHQTMSLINKFNNLPGVGREIALLFRFKRAFLERIKMNDWNDIPNFY